MVCVIGLLYQIIEISTSYFAFDATTTVTMEMPNKVDIPALSVCWRYGDIIDLDALRRKNSEIPVFDFTNDETIKNSGWTVQSMATVRQVYDFTPSLDNTFADCIIRVPQCYSAQRFNVSECRKQFTVIQFFTMVSFCFAMSIIREIIPLGVHLLHH